MIQIGDWVALKLGIEITIHGHKIGMVDEKFVSIWEGVRARGLGRYAVERGVIAAIVFGPFWFLLSSMRIRHVDWSIMIGGMLLCFVIVLLFSPIIWWRHEDRSLRLTAPWMVKRFD